MTSKIGGDTVEPVSAARNGCATLPNARPCGFGELPRPGLKLSLPPILHCGKRLRERGHGVTSIVIEQSHGLIIGPNRPRSEIEGGAFGKLHESLGALLEAGHGAQQDRFVRDRGRPSDRLGKERPQRLDQMGIVGLAQIVAVEVGELGQVETRRRAADALEVEPVDRLFRGNDLGVAVAPAQAQQIIAHRLGQMPMIAIGVDAQRAVAFRSLAPSAPWISGIWAKSGGVQPQALVELDLPEGVGEMVVAADHMGDAHVVIVDHHRSI